MNLKAYYGGSVEEALAQAKRDVGPDAMLVRSQRRGTSAGDYEVVVALPESDGPSLPSPREPAPTSSEMAWLRSQLESLTRTVTEAETLRSAAQWRNTELAAAHDLLLRQEVPASAALRIMRRTEERHSAPAPGVRTFAEHLSQARAGAGAGTGRVRSLLRLGLEATISFRAADAARGPSAMAFVGPPGSGKTTTLIKIAAAQNLRASRPPVLIAADGERVGAIEQLRTYGTILGVTVAVASTPAALRQALDEHRPKGLVLVDMPGFAPREIASAEPMFRALASHADVETHLVLSGTMRPGDLRDATERHAAARPASLLFTRMDETRSFGSVLGEAVASGLPLSYLGTGQQIPDDLVPAGMEHLLDCLCGADANAVGTAA